MKAKEGLVIDDIVEEFIDDENEMDMGGGSHSKKDEMEVISSRWCSLTPQ